MKRAFTLIELILVIVIIGILSGIAVVRYGSVIEGARSAEAYSVLAQIVSAENVYRLEHNAYVGCNPCDTVLDINLPSSENFTFRVPNATVNGFARAAHITGRGTQDYFMCLDGGRKSSGFSAPTCP